ncbi:hypothetical protein [Streptomyces auratus]|nr:hypothetical protein [Streptomyces auratus]QTZ92194.1 hypothetical protein SU9_012490 [Streptomyces auratus AGR0001]
MMTTAADVERFFASEGRARRELESWRRRKPEVAERVMAHASVAPYGVRSEEFSRFRSGHPLGQIASKAAYKEVDIQNWRPDFAMVHLFHFCLEANGGLFSYEDFRQFCRTDDTGRAFSQQAQRTLQELVEVDGHDPEASKRAMTWRVGNAYYSFLREIYLVTTFREAGLDARIHPLADALFRVDAWCGTATVEMYVANPRFKQGQTGRKAKTAEYLEDQGRFGFVRLEMKPQHRHGVLHLPTRDEVDRCISDLRQWRGVAYI